MQIIRIYANNCQRVAGCLRNSVDTFLRRNWNLKEIRELCHDDYDSTEDLANKIVYRNGFVMKAARDQDTSYLVYLAESNDSSEVHYGIIGEIPYAVIVPSNDECYEFVDIDDDIWRSGIIRIKS